MFAYTYLGKEYDCIPIFIGAQLVLQTSYYFNARNEIFNIAFRFLMHSSHTELQNSNKQNNPLHVL